METVICDASAFAIWRTPPFVRLLANPLFLGTRFDIPLERLVRFRGDLMQEQGLWPLGSARHIPGPAVSFEVGGGVLLDLRTLLASLDGPVDVLVGSRSERRPSELLRPHVMTPSLVEGELRPLRRHLALTSPALTLLQLARTLSLPRLIAAASELCGAFATYRAPASVAAIIEELNAGPGVPILDGWVPSFDDGGHLTDVWSRPAPTTPSEIAALAARILHDPELVSVTPPASVVETIAQRVHFAEKSEKSALLIDLLRHSEARQVLVFTRTKHGADRLARILNKTGIEAAALHGNKSQNARVRAMNDFKSGACRVLIATDIAARGIDIDQLPLVINYELPEVAETYVHRIGRTGRAGRDGAAWSFCSEAELEYLLDIQRLTGLTIPVEGEVPEYAARALAEAERKQAAKAGRRSAPHSAPKADPAPKRKGKEARPAAKPAGAPAIAPQAEIREKAERKEQGEKTGKAPQPQPSEHLEKPDKRESSEISAAENAPKKRRRRRHRGQEAENGAGHGPEEAGAERAEPAAMESSAATAETSGTKPAAGVSRPSHAATKPAEPTGSRSGAAPEAAAGSQPASATSAASTPESGDNPRKRHRQTRPRKNNRRHAPEPNATRRIRRHAPKKPGHAARPAPTRRRKSRKPGSNAPGNGRCPTMKTNKWRHKNAIHTRTIGKTALNHYFCDHSGNRRGGVSGKEPARFPTRPFPKQ